MTEIIFLSTTGDLWETVCLCGEEDQRECWSSHRWGGEQFRHICSRHLRLWSLWSQQVFHLYFTYFTVSHHVRIINRYISYTVSSIYWGWLTNFKKFAEIFFDLKNWCYELVGLSTSFSCCCCWMQFWAVLHQLLQWEAPAVVCGAGSEERASWVQEWGDWVGTHWLLQQWTNLQNDGRQPWGERERFR